MIHNASCSQTEYNFLRCTLHTGFYIIPMGKYFYESHRVKRFSHGHCKIDCTYMYLRVNRFSNVRVKRMVVCILPRRHCKIFLHGL